MIVNPPVPYFLKGDITLPSLLSDPSLNSKMTDESFYPAVRPYITVSEDVRGNYDYSHVSNVGMVYLFIHRRGANRKANTKGEYARELLQFLRHSADNDIFDIRSLKRAQLEAYQEWLSLKYPKTKTQAKKVTILSAFLLWCFDEGYLERDLSRGLSAVKLDKKQIPDREIDVASLQRAITYYEHDPKFRSLLMLLATTGLRLNEVITPKWGDVYFDTMRKKHYVRTETKRDGVRHALLKDYVLQELIEYRRRLGLKTSLDPEDVSPFYPNRSGKHYRLTSLSAIVTKKMAAAKLRTTRNEKTTAHFLRHFFARSAFQNGASTDRIARTLGHSTSRITEENYLHRELKKEFDVSEFVELTGLGEQVK